MSKSRTTNSTSRSPAPYAIGIDVGGTRMKCGAVSPAGKVLHAATLPTHAERGPDHLLQALTDYVIAAQDELGRPARAVGLGLSGAVDPAKGPVLLPGKFKGLEGFPIVPRLARKTGLPVVAENDARAAMIAEKTYGLAKNQKWVVMVTLGTGLGSGVVLDGQILRDPHLQFGTQLGFLVLRAASGRLCLSGARGTAEMFCAATALGNAVRDALARGIESSLSEAYWQNPASIDFAAVVSAAQKGDRLAKDELRIWTENLGWLLVSAVHAYAPELIILGGGGAKAAPSFLPALQKHVNQHIFRYPRGQKVPIVTSRLGDHAGILGAAAVAWESVK